MFRSRIAASLLGAGCVFAATGCVTDMRRHADSGHSSVSLAAADFDRRPESAESLARSAKRAETERNVDRAIELYEQARRADPGRRGVTHRLAVLSVRRGDPERADVEFQRALQISPDDADLLCDLGFFLLETGRLDEAESRLRQSLRIDPRHESARINLAIVLAEQGDYLSSRELFAGVVGDAAAWSNVGAIMARKGDWESAEIACRNALSLDPSLPQPQAVLAHGRRRANESEIVSAAYER